MKLLQFIISIAVLRENLIQFQAPVSQNGISPRFFWSRVKQGIQAGSFINSIGKRCISILLFVFPFIVSAQLPKHRLILIGDAGRLENGSHPVVDSVIKSGLLQENTSVVFLGDNVYFHGLPSKDAPSYNKYKNVLDAQAAIARKTNAQVYFIPGNHDWANGKSYGLNFLQNQQRYIDSLQLPNLHFFPKDGCPGPEEIQLSPNVILVVMDSQWWLHSGEKPGIESDCDCKTTDEVTTKLKNIAARNPNSLLLFASHHPFRSNGPHGRYFTLKQHIFPLTDIKDFLWVPLPVIGSIYPIARGVFGNIQDIPHPKYKKMIRQVEAAFKNHPNVIFLHGHDHGLQFIKEDGRNYIISGSASEVTRVKHKANSPITIERKGYVVMDIYEDLSTKLGFNTISQGNMATQHIPFNIPEVKEKTPGEPLYNTNPVTIAAGANYNKASGFKRFLFGKNYRKEWGEPVTFRVFELNKEKGGLKILQRGGGKQTKSLRLEDATGKQWVIRSIDKNPINAIPPELRETFARDVVQDQISAAHPYAPLVVPVLATATGIPHASPELVWIPNDTAFGIHQQDFANTLCLFEEREPGITGNKSYSTAKVLEQLLEDNDNRINQQAVLNARLFDMFITDFDRHEDQWRWGAEKTEKGKMYYPVPRDRDQAFFINNGFITGLIAAPHLLPQVQGLKKKYRNINTFNFTTRYFDRNFLNTLNENEWREAATKMVAALTDEVIEQAINQLPGNIKKISESYLSNTLKEKRKYFVADVMKYYHFLARTIELTGSNKKEVFRLARDTEGKVILMQFKISKKEEWTPMAYRVIDPSVTKEIRLYGMGGDDLFITDSSLSSSIKVRMIGGSGNDRYETNASLKTIIYDLETEQNDITKAAGAKIKINARPEVNTYNRTAFKYNQRIPQFVFGFNPDDGLSLGAGIKIIRQGFRKSPQAAIYNISGSHSLSTKAFRFKIQADFTDVIGKTGLGLYADIKSPNNTINFFGYGNETSYANPGKATVRFHRARYNLLEAGALLKNNFGRTLHLSYGGGFTYYRIDSLENANRFITQTATNGLSTGKIFDPKYFLTGKINLDIDSRNNKVNPSRGVHWQSSLTLNKGLNSASENTAILYTDLAFYASLNDPARFIFASRFGAGHIWGDFAFFQALTLGNNQNLRGYRNYRFSGRNILFNNTELRMKLFDFAGYLFPGTAGLILFNDIGKVWQKKEHSPVIHNTPGAGVYIAPAGLLVISATVGFSKEETLPLITMGFRF
jgi:Omp85 superfamily domain/Calcineurin-like phosphoesterase